MFASMSYSQYGQSSLHILAALCLHGAVADFSQKSADKEAERGRCSATRAGKQTRALQAETLLFGQKIEQNNETALIGLSINLASYLYVAFWIQSLLNMRISVSSSTSDCLDLYSYER